MSQWVGASCADKPLRADMPCESMHSADWQSRALECKAQKMATKLAEQLYKEKAKQLAQEAQEYLAKQGRPPCECHPSSCLPSPPVIPHTQCHCPSSGASRGAGNLNYIQLIICCLFFQTYFSVKHICKKSYFSFSCVPMSC